MTSLAHCIAEHWRSGTKEALYKLLYKQKSYIFLSPFLGQNLGHVLLLQQSSIVRERVECKKWNWSYLKWNWSEFVGECPSLHQNTGLTYFYFSLPLSLFLFLSLSLFLFIYFSIYIFISLFLSLSISLPLSLSIYLYIYIYLYYSISLSLCLSLSLSLSLILQCYQWKQKVS